MALPVAINHMAWGQRYTVYTFVKAGDELPLHSHDDAEHISIVGNGSFICFDDKGKEKALVAGDCVLFSVSRIHGLRALTDGATLVQCWEPINGTGNNNIG